jgi:hypothetical protein
MRVEDERVLIADAKTTFLGKICVDCSILASATTSAKKPRQQLLEYRIVLQYFLCLDDDRLLVAEERNI